MTVLAVLLALLAPAPKEKPPPPLPAIERGEYVMNWHGTECPTVFHGDGFYACQWRGRWWHGQWKMDKGRLLVEEWPMEEPHRRSTWTVSLKCKHTGAFAGGTRWKIIPLAGRVY